jgi:hypothetical protein
MLVANHRFFGLNHRTAFPLAVRLIDWASSCALVGVPVPGKKERGK